jgi:hypothetical protein
LFFLEKKNNKNPTGWGGRGNLGFPVLFRKKNYKKSSGWGGRGKLGFPT